MRSSSEIGGTMPRVGVVTTRELTYPSQDGFSPDSAYPEYPFGASELSAKNHVYELVRALLRDLGCDKERFGTREWNPLGEWIKRGQRVFILPNFVMHRRNGESALAFQAKC